MSAGKFMATFNRSELFKFYSNRNLLIWPRSRETLACDLKNELCIDYNSAANSFVALKVQNQINHKIQNDESYDTTQFKKYIKEVLNSQNSEYRKLSTSPYQALKNLYRITVPNFIFEFIELNQEVIPSVITDKIAPIVSGTTYNRQNSKLSNYIQKICLMNALNSIDKNSKEFYNYNRFVTLYNMIINQNLTPMAYNVRTGALYFTFSYNLYKEKEQIFENLRKNSSNLISPNIEEVRYYINTEYGEIATVRKLFDKRVKRYKTDVSDQMAFSMPNIVRMIIHDLFSKFSNKNYKLSYTQMLGYRLRNTIIVEDYCEKINRDGSTFSVPINNKWETMSAKEVRLLSKASIDEGLVLETYKDLLNSIKQVMTEFKS